MKETTRRVTTLTVLKLNTTLERIQPQLSNSSRTTDKLLKIYIYKLGSEFNTDIADSIQSRSRIKPYCFDYSNHGMGKLLYKDGGISVYDTNQFSLDVILHHQFMHSRYRTHDPSEADVFYIPAYLGSLFFYRKINKSVLINQTFEYLANMSFFAQVKPHIISLAKTECEQRDIILKHPWWKNLTYLTIEKVDANSRHAVKLESQRAIVVPYPSYVHLNYTNVDSARVKLLSTSNRHVFLFLAASLQKTNPFRSKIIKLFSSKTQLSFTEYYKSKDNANIDEVMLVTPECRGNHKNTTIQWMQNSIFCLQPHGDSPTRKSFYDSILSGCIPVVFKFPNENVEFPFQTTLNYSDFMVRIPVDFKGYLKGNITIYNFLQNISLTEINRLHSNLLKILPLFQYTVITRERHNKQKDALDMIVDEIRAMYNL